MALRILLSLSSLSSFILDNYSRRLLASLGSEISVREKLNTIGGKKGNSNVWMLLWILCGNEEELSMLDIKMRIFISNTCIIA